MSPYLLLNSLVRMDDHLWEVQKERREFRRKGDSLTAFLLPLGTALAGAESIAVFDDGVFNSDRQLTPPAETPDCVSFHCTTPVFIWSVLGASSFYIENGFGISPRTFKTND